MHKARAFFFVCAGILCLMVAYHLGARSAGAQAAGTIAGVLEHRTATSYGGLIVVTQSGDCYMAQLDEFRGVISGPPRPLGNFWSGAKAARDSTIGQIKAKHR
jgi:hypothetical protein